MYVNINHLYSGLNGWYSMAGEPCDLGIAQSDHYNFPSTLTSWTFPLQGYLENKVLDFDCITLGVRVHGEKPKQKGCSYARFSEISKTETTGRSFLGKCPTTELFPTSPLWKFLFCFVFLNSLRISNIINPILLFHGFKSIFWEEIQKLILRCSSWEKKEMTTNFCSSESTGIFMFCVDLLCARFG